MQAFTPSNAAVRASRVRPANAVAKRAFIAGQTAGRAGGEERIVLQAGHPQQFCVVFGLDRHAADDQRGITRVQRCGIEVQPLQHARTEAFQQTSAQAARSRATARPVSVHRPARRSARRRLSVRRAASPRTAPGRAPGQLHHPHACQRPREGGGGGKWRSEHGLSHHHRAAVDDDRLPGDKGGAPPEQEVRSA